MEEKKTEFVDPVTGYKSKKGRNWSLQGFNAREKQKFLAYYHESGDLSKSARATGFDKNTIYTAFKHDEKFKEDFDLVRLSQKHELEGLMLQYGKAKNGYMHMITWLRKNYPEEYNPKAVIMHKSNRDLDVDLEALKASAIEGEVISEENSPPPEAA